jgi:hypothetical protein
MEVQPWTPEPRTVLDGSRGSVLRAGAGLQPLPHRLARAVRARFTGSFFTLELS